MESDSKRNEAEVVCNEEKVNPATIKWKWGEDDLVPTSIRTLA